jgi:hypothetical protein
LRIVRSLAAVVIGFVFVLLSLRLLPLIVGDPDGLTDRQGFQVLTLVWTVVAAVIAGYLTALIAGAHEFPHAASVGFLLILASLISIRQHALVRPGWYEITIAGCGPISAMIGCALRLLTKRRPNPR